MNFLYAWLPVACLLGAANKNQHGIICLHFLGQMAKVSDGSQNTMDLVKLKKRIAAKKLRYEKIQRNGQDIEKLRDVILVILSHFREFSLYKLVKTR